LNESDLVERVEQRLELEEQDPLGQVWLVWRTRFEEV